MEHLIANSGIHYISREIEFNPSEPLILNNGRTLKYTFYDGIDFLEGTRVFELMYYHNDEGKYIPLEELQNADNAIIRRPNGREKLDETGMPVMTPGYPTTLFTTYNDGEEGLVSINSLQSFRVKDPKDSRMQIAAFDLLLDNWLPMPMFYKEVDGITSNLPLGWCRMKMMKIGEGEKKGVCRYRLVWAFDTQTGDDLSILRPYINREESESLEFCLCNKTDLMMDFLSSSEEFHAFSEYIATLMGIDISHEESRRYKAFYIYFCNFIRLIGAAPDVTLHTKGFNQIDHLRFENNKPHFTIGTLGNVDDGKTTLTSAITKVLSKRILENQKILRQFDQPDMFLGEPMFTKTTQVEYETAKRHYTHIDCPGHTENIKKLMEDVAQINGAIIVVSPPDGDEPLTLIHLLLARLLNVPRVVVFINKCDMEVDEDILNIIEIEMQDLLEMLEFEEDTPFIRGSALGALNGVPEWEDMVMELVNAVDDWILMPDNSQPSISPIKILNNVISRSIHFITRDLEPTRLFLSVCEQLIKQGLNNDDLGQIRIIQSLCCLKYSATHLDDNSLLRKGEECVDIGFNLKREKNEDSTLLYSFIKLIYRRIKINNNNSNAYNQHNNINNEFRSLQARKSAENNEIFAWLKDNIYFPASFNCIQASYYNYLNNKDYVNAANCLHLIQDLNVDYYTVWTCNEFYNLYTMENGLQPINKAYEYSEQGIQIANDSEHFNSDYIDLNNVFYVAWCHCWNNLGLCYYNGYGVNPDGAEVFKCFETAAQLGLHVAINNLAYCYENGIGVDEDCFTACELYKKAFEAGFEDAKAEYERLVSLGYDDSQNRNNVGSGNGYNDHQQMQWDDTYPTRETPNNSNKPNPSIDNTFDW